MLYVAVTLSAVAVTGWKKPTQCSAGAAQASGSSAADSTSGGAPFASPVSATLVACLSVLGAAFALS